MTRNNQKLQFKGGWDQLVHAKELATQALTSGSPISSNWKPDGTIMLVGDGASDTIKEMEAVTPWSVTGLNETDESSNFSAVEPNVRTVDVADDGSRLWLSGLGSNQIHQLDMSVQWDVTTLDVTAPPTFNPPNSSDTIVGLKVIDKGRKLFLLVTDIVFDYTFNTPGDITGGMITGTSISLTAQSTDMTEIEFSTDGRFMYALSRSPYKIFRYRLNTRNTLADGITFLDDVDLTDSQLAAFGLFIKPTDGKKLYTVGFNPDTIAEYDMSLLENNTRITRLGDERVTRAGEPLVNRG